MNRFKDNTLETIVYTFHYQHFPASAALAMLGEMTEGLCTYTLEDVKEMYRKIEEGEIGLKKKLDFCDLPEKFLKNVVKELDWINRMKLRKTCKTLRRLVDEHPHRVEKFYVWYGRRDVQFEINDDLKVKYWSWDKGDLCRVYAIGSEEKKDIQGEKEKLMENDLKTFFINPNLEIGELRFYHLSNQVQSGDLFEFLSNMNHQVHVERLNYQRYFDPEFITKLLKCFKPGVLHTIEPHPQASSDLVLGRGVFELEQWKKAKVFMSICVVPTKDFIHFAHFNRVIVVTPAYKMAGKTILAIKDKLLENPDFGSMMIKTPRYWDQVGKMRKALLPFTVDDEWAHFQYPGSDKKLLIRVYYNLVWFKMSSYEPDRQDGFLIPREKTPDYASGPRRS